MLQKNKFANNWRWAKIALQKIHSKIANVRRNCSRYIIYLNQVIA